MSVRLICKYCRQAESQEAGKPPNSALQRTRARARPEVRCVTLGARR